MRTVLVEFPTVDQDTEDLLACGATVMERGVRANKSYAIVGVEHIGTFYDCVKSRAKGRAARLFACLPPGRTLGELVDRIAKHDGDQGPG